MKKLTDMRERRGLTQIDLAAAMETSQAAVSKWETGKHRPHRSTLKRLARALRCTVEELTEGAPPPLIPAGRRQPPVAVGDGNSTRIPVVGAVPALTAALVQVAVLHGVNPGATWAAFLEAGPPLEDFGGFCAGRAQAAQEAQGEAQGAEPSGDSLKAGSPSPAPPAQPGELYDHLVGRTWPRGKDHRPPRALTLQRGGMQLAPLPDLSTPSQPEAIQTPEPQK